jgi:hypothetical protein
VYFYFVGKEGNKMAVTYKITGLTEHFTLNDYGKNQSGMIPINSKSLLHATMLEEFRQWLGRPMDVHGWYRTKAYNKSVNGVATSSHLRGVATDWSTNVEITEEKFVKYAKKWKEICEAHDTVGEAGLYTWGMHLGSSVNYSTKFTNWDSRSGKQINNKFKI